MEPEKFTEINQITQKFIGCAIEVHQIHGLGLLESTNEESLAFEFSQIGLIFERQKEIPFGYKDNNLSRNDRVDFVVNQFVIVD